MTHQAAVAFEVPPYAKAAGIVGLILGIIGWLVPVAGVLFITPLSIVCGVVALYGGYKPIGIAIAVVAAVNLAISPTFWLNVGAGAIGGSMANRALTYFDVIGVLLMLFFAVRKSASRTGL